MSRFRPLRLSVVAAVIALGLAACAAPRTVTHVSSLNDVFDYVITSHLPLDVTGNPFPGAPDMQVAQAAAAGMSGNVNGRPLTFVLRPGPAAGAAGSSSPFSFAASSLAGSSLAASTPAPLPFGFE